MSEKIVIARRVRLVQPAPCDRNGGVGNDWTTNKVDNLVVFPDSCLARCTINDRTYAGRFAWYEADSQTQEQWEKGGLFVCPDCGQSFENSQGLATHRSIKHGNKR